MKKILMIGLLTLCFLPKLSNAFDIHERFVMGGVSENFDTSLYEIAGYSTLPKILDLIIVWSSEAGEGYDTEWKQFACKYLKQAVISRYNTMKINVLLTRWFCQRGGNINEKR